MTDVERRYVGGSLSKLWDDNGEFGQCVKDVLTEEDIRAMLRETPIRFVEVDVGRPLRWIPLNERFEFWKSICPNLHVLEKPYLEDYPSCFFYAASEWTGRDGERLIVLKKFH
ncbi:hypothetical protein [Sinorhizobium arboris]|uniref:hypothetical protein n=1 Tax=Sinorhizobium arboris TaxID=76745 RepID=UPI00047F2E25|nr:hypothetical protein [Sinorhizobium arboris]